MKINFIIERLFTFFKVDSNVGLAQKLGVSATTLSNWKKRNTINYDILFTKCEGVNFNWLFLGIGEMRLRNYDHSKSIAAIVEEYPPNNLETFNEVLRAKNETIETQRRLIYFLEDELNKKHIPQEEPGDAGQKRKAG